MGVYVTEDYFRKENRVNKSFSIVPEKRQNMNTIRFKTS